MKTHCPACGSPETESGQPSTRLFFGCGSYLYKTSSALVDQTELCELRAEVKMVSSDSKLLANLSQFVCEIKIDPHAGPDEFKFTVQVFPDNAGVGLGQANDFASAARMALEDAGGLRIQL